MGGSEYRRPRAARAVAGRGERPALLPGLRQHERRAGVLHRHVCSAQDRETTHVSYASHADSAATAWQRLLIHAFDPERGFVLMEDLGPTDFAAAYETHDVDTLLDAAVDSLVRLQTLSANEIPPYTVARFADELDIFVDWLIGRFLGLAVPAEFAATKETLIEATQTVPARVVHRDYHCRNLIWREDGTVGIVDFQDALVGPACYDIASLLRDCYIEFPEADVRRWRHRFFGLADLDCDQAVFDRAFDLTAMQRQLKAVGIFARLYLSHGRSSHLGDIVPVLERIARLAAEYPETATLADWLAAEVAPAATARLATIA